MNQKLYTHIQDKVSKTRPCLVISSGLGNPALGRTGQVGQGFFAIPIHHLWVLESPPSLEKHL